MRKIEITEKHVERLEEKLKKEIVRNEAGGIGYDVSLIRVMPKVGQIAGTNNLLSNDIQIYISPSFELDENIQEYFGLKDPFKIIEKIAFDITRHEIGHWEYPYQSKMGCPYDFFIAEEIFNGVKKGLGRDDNTVDYVANMFMDIIANTNIAYQLNKRKEKFKGQVFFYYDQGKDNQAGKEYSPIYSWFVKIQEDLWMDKEDRKLLKPFHNKELQEKIEELEDRLFAELGLKKYDYNMRLLMNKDGWEYQAEVFARIASELLPYGIPLEVLTGGENIKKKSPIEKRIKDPYFLGKVIRRRWEKGKDLPVYVKTGKVLSYLYKELARDIPIRANAYSQNFSFPAVGFGKKEAEGITRKIGINEKGEITFYKPKHFWEMQIPVKKSVGGIPNIYFLIDSSGSMEEGYGREIPNSSWGDESKYHYALLGFFGIMNYLERMQILPSKIAVTSFSDYSISAMCNPSDLSKIEKVLFSPQFGNTFIDISEVRKIAKEMGKSVIVMLSDGEIFNWSKVKNEMKEIFNKNYSAFISIGAKSYPFYDLRDVAKIFYVGKKEDLPKIMIDFTREAYGESS